MQISDLPSLQCNQQDARQKDRVGAKYIVRGEREVEKEEMKHKIDSVISIVCRQVTTALAIS